MDSSSAMDAADVIIAGEHRRRDDERRRHRQHRKSSNDVATQSRVRLLPLLVVVTVIVMVGGTFAFTSSSSSPSSSSTTRTPFVARFTTPPFNIHHRSPQYTSSSSSLHGGYGIAESYSWKEDQFELEIRVNVPRGTSASDVSFKCASDSIDLRLIGTVDDGILLDGTRKLRGRVCVDGTYWSIDGGGGGGTKDANRTVTVTIEKSFVPSSISRTDGTVTYDSSTIFDWGGVYVDDVNERNEVTVREYDEPVELDVREYASTLGVDIDNIDMTKVNKTMFGAGLRKDDANADSAPRDGGMNDEDDPGLGAGQTDGFRFDINQATLERLTRAGLAKEVVRQADGSEYELGMITGDGTGGASGGDGERAFSMLGNDVSYEELLEAGMVGGGIGTIRSESLVEPDESIDDGMGNADIIDTNDGGDDVSTKPRDPIDILTVARLKEVLRAQGLKSTGAKQALRDRLRDHVKSLLREE